MNHASEYNFYLPSILIRLCKYRNYSTKLMKLMYVNVIIERKPNFKSQKLIAL